MARGSTSSPSRRSVRARPYYPDSTTTSFDKQNIRDGHYTLWSPTVYIAPVDDAGAPVNPAVKYITDLVLGNPGASPPSGLPDGGTPIDGLGAIVSVGLTPDCAMQVQRSSDGAPLSPYTPPAPCTCYFLSKIPSAGYASGELRDVLGEQPLREWATCFNGYCEVAPARRRPPGPPAAMWPTADTRAS